MDVLVLADDRSQVGRRLLQRIRLVVPEERLGVYRSFNELYQRLERSQNGLKAVLLLAETRAQLLQLRPMGALPEHPPLILVLPERSKEVIQVGFALQPCFSTFADSTFHEITPVLNHILGQSPG
jgi:hypothetical protein